VTKSPEERLSALEEAFVSLKEGMSRVEKGVGKLEETFAVLMDKLDSRYPSKENVDLRFKEIQTEIVVLRLQVADNTKRIYALNAWLYKAMGAVAVVGFGLGIAAQHIKW